MPTRIDDRNQYFSTNLQALRRQFNLSQDDLGKALNIKSQYPGAIVSGWERQAREPSFNQLVNLAEFFGVSTDYLLGLKKAEDPFSQRMSYLILKANDNLSEEDKKRLIATIQAFVNS